MSVPVSPRRVFGVDFSGARDAGRRIWVCRAHPGSDGIRIESVDPLVELPGGSRRRDAALRALVQKVAEAPRSAWGLDFPFALPQPLAAALTGLEQPDLDEQIRALVAHDDADEFRAACRRRFTDELRRATDREVSTPFSPYNLRLYKQTWYGMTAVLHPLRGNPDVAVLPLDALPAGTAEPDGRLPANVRRPAARLPHIYVLEVCPASLLRDLGYVPELGRYKGRGDAPQQRRAIILRRFVEDGLVRPPERRVRRRVVEDRGGDGLDAVLAAIAAWRGYRAHDHRALHADPRYATEGYVYL